MSYYVLKKDADEKPGKTTLFDKVLYYVTSLSPPTKFKSEELVRKAIEFFKGKISKFKIQGYRRGGNDMKILYCIAGAGFYGVLESDILEQDKFFISAKRVFSIEVNPQAIRSPRGEAMSFMISTYEDVILNCTFVSNMSEKATFYQKILEIFEKEKSHEN